MPAVLKSLRIASCLGFCSILGTILMPINVGLAQSDGAAAPVDILPEEQGLPLVTQISGDLGTKISGASCQEFNQLLDEAQAEAKDPNRDETTLMNQLLKSVQTNPKYRSIVLENMGAPLINKILDCNLVPVKALTKP